MEKRDLAIFKQTDEYQSIIEDCKAIMTERTFLARMERILGYGQIGERIFNDPLYKKWDRSNSQFLEMVSFDTGITYGDLCRAIQFYEKFGIVSPDSENWSMLKRGKAETWSSIKKDYLPSKKMACEHDLEEIVVLKCSKCGKIVKDEK